MTVTSTDVVVGVDGSTAAANAVRWAASLVARRGARLHLLHAYEPSVAEIRGGAGRPATAPADRRRAAERDLAAVRATVLSEQPGISVACEVVEDAASNALIEASRGAGAVVIGARGVRGFGALVAGSTAMNLAAHASGTVVTVPADPQRAFGGYGVVVGVDGSELSSAALAHGFREATETGAALTAVLAWVDPAEATFAQAGPFAEVGDVVRGHEIVLAETLAGWADTYPDVPVTALVVHDRPVQALADASEGAQLLVVGCRGRSALRSMLLGSVSQGVLHLAACPVAVVHDRPAGM